MSQWAETGDVIGYLCDQPVYCKWDPKADGRFREMGGHVASVTIRGVVYIGEGHYQEDAFDNLKREVERSSAC